MSSHLLNRIIIDLRIIAKIPENGKISTTTTDPIRVETITTAQGFHRWIWGDSREQSYTALRNLVNNIVDISDNILQSRYMNIPLNELTPHELSEFNRCHSQLKTLAKEINNSLQGFSNLHRTYENDATISSKLEVLMSNLNDQKNKIEASLE